MTGKAEIDINEWGKLDLRIAQVLEAERIEKSEKLVKLKIDLDDETRTIVAGIAKAYSAEELIGRQIVVLANLKPARIRGIESKGMLLAAVDGEHIALVTPDHEISNGAAVS
jgi:methionine--tRNA ligase beta chain